MKKHRRSADGRSSGNYDYPRYLARAAGLEILLPPREWLGNPWRESRHADLVDWLTQTAPRADAVIVAIDTLAYGGLIPSRTSSEATETVIARLEVLRRLKAARPSSPCSRRASFLHLARQFQRGGKTLLAVYGSRCSGSPTSNTRPGWATPRRRKRLSATPCAPRSDEVYRDYRQGRARNHAVNRAMLDWLADGMLDYLLLPQDDTADYGWNIAEARELQALIRQRRLGDRAITYPGADEIGCLLLAGYVCRQAGFKPKVWAAIFRASPATRS